MPLTMNAAWRLSNYRPYHVFKYHGHRFCYAAARNSLLRISDPLYLALKAHEQLPNWNDGHRHLSQDLHERALDALRPDLDDLDRFGVFAERPLRSHPQRNADRIVQHLEALEGHSPFHIMFLVTNRCNLGCTYCYEKSQGFHSRSQMGLAETRHLVDKFIERSGDRDCLSITLFGGEPLLNLSAVKSIVEYARERTSTLRKDVVFSMTTNLTVLTNDALDFLLRHRIAVLVSLDGDEVQHNRHRRFPSGRGSYSQVVRNLKRLQEAQDVLGLRLTKLRATLTRQNMDRFGVERHLRTFGTCETMVGASCGRLHREMQCDITTGNGGSAVLIRSMEAHVGKYLKDLRRGKHAVLTEAVKESIRDIHQRLAEPPGEVAVDDYRMCGVCRNMMAVVPGGDYFPCHRFVGMSAFKIGNAFTGGPDPERTRKFYQELLSGFAKTCAKCWAVHLCGGMCPWTIANDDQGTFYPMTGHHCQETTRAIEKMLGLYGVLLLEHDDELQRILANPSERATS